MDRQPAGFDVRTVFDLGGVAEPSLVRLFRLLHLDIAVRAKRNSSRVLDSNRSLACLFQLDRLEAYPTKAVLLRPIRNAASVFQMNAWRWRAVVTSPFYAHEHASQEHKDGREDHHHRVDGNRMFG